MSARRLRGDADDELEEDEWNVFLFIESVQQVAYAAGEPNAGRPDGAEAETGLKVELGHGSVRLREPGQVEANAEDPLDLGVDVEFEVHSTPAEDVAGIVTARAKQNSWSEADDSLGDPELVLEPQGPRHRE